MSERELQSEAYLDIVWRQFKKNRFATISLAILAPLFLVAIFAPLLALEPAASLPRSRRREETLYPWFRGLFNASEQVDFVFNMALVGVIPWLLVSLALNWWWKRRGMAGPVSESCSSPRSSCW